MIRDFKTFRHYLQIAVMMEAMTEEEKEDFFNDWYETFKGIYPEGASLLSFVNFIEEQFQDVSARTSEYWVSRPGLHSILMEDRFDNYNPFPVFGTLNQ